MEEIMLTTTQNPWNPFTQFDEWYNFDMNFGHNCLGYIARIGKYSDNLTEEEELFITNSTIREIAKENVFGDFRIIKRDGTFVDPYSLEIDDKTESQ